MIEKGPAILDHLLSVSPPDNPPTPLETDPLTALDNLSNRTGTVTFDLIRGIKTSLPVV